MSYTRPAYNAADASFQGEAAYTRPSYNAANAWFATVDLVAVDGSHGHLADAITLTFASVALVATDGSHGQTADPVTLTFASVALAVADGSHGHAADAVALGRTSPISVSDSDHTHVADAAPLSVCLGLIVADAEHTASSDSAALWLTIQLLIANASQDVLSDLVDVVFVPHAEDIPLCVMATHILHPDGSPVQGAIVLSRLNRSVIDLSGAFIVPGTAHSETDANGRADAALWPNGRGNWVTHYDVRINTIGARSGRFEVTADGTDAHRSLGLVVPPPAGPTRVVLAFDFRRVDEDNVEYFEPAAGLQVVIQPDRWDVVDDGFVAPTASQVVTDEQGIATVEVLASGALAAELTVRVTDAAGRRRALRLRVPVADEVLASSIEIPDPCEPSPRIVLREAA